MERGDGPIPTPDFRGFQTFSDGLVGLPMGTHDHDFGCPKSQWSGARAILIFGPNL